MAKPILQTISDWNAHAAAGGLYSYLVIDGSWQEDLVRLARSIADGWEPLMGEPGERKHEAHRRSPLLIDLNQRPEILEPWVADGFKERLGIVIYARFGLQAMRTSLKRFQTVLLPDSAKPSYFRFFDARTLHCFLSTGFPAQWQDFMQGIELIAAPSDFAHGWTAYRLADEGLEAGREADGTLSWSNIPPQGADKSYEAAFPFRRIGEPQYSALMRCADRSFSIEIALFLIEAFPEECRDINKNELLDLVSDARRKGQALGYDTEDAQFYFAVLAFMGGRDFDEKPEAKSFLSYQYFDPATKLEKWLQEVCRIIPNPKLENLVDKTEVTVTYASGRKVRYRQFSGTILDQK